MSSARRTARTASTGASGLEIGRAEKRQRLPVFPVAQFHRFFQVVDRFREAVLEPEQ